MKQSQKILCLVFFALAAAIILGFVSIRVSNDQIVQPEFRTNSIKKNFKNFEHIHILGKMDITIAKSTRWAFILEDYSLQALNNLNIYQEGTAIYIKEIDTISNLINKPNIKIKLKVPSLNSINATGSSNIKIKNFTGNKLLINASGSSYFKALNVIYDELTVKATDSTNLRLQKLIATNLNANLSNTAKLSIRMGNGTLIANASDNSRLRYLGKPSDIQAKTTGSAKVHKKKK